MKKKLAMLLAAAMIFSLFTCGKASALTAAPDLSEHVDLTMVIQTVPG